MPQAQDDLSAEERAELAALLRAAIAASHYPLSPQVKLWKAILAKLDPAASPPSPATVPYPAPRPSAEPSHLYAKLKGRRRRHR